MKLNKNIKFIGVCAILLLLVGIVYFFLAIYHPDSGTYVAAYILPDEPSRYIEMTPEELAKYPYAYEAVLHPGTDIKVPPENADSIEEYKNATVRLHNTYNLKINGTYYEVNILSAD